MATTIADPVERTKALLKRVQAHDQRLPDGSWEGFVSVDGVEILVGRAADSKAIARIVQNAQRAKTLELMAAEGLSLPEGYAIRGGRRS